MIQNGQFANQDLAKKYGKYSAHDIASQLSFERSSRQWEDCRLEKRNLTNLLHVDGVGQGFTTILYHNYS